MLGLVLAGCASPPRNGLTQVVTIDALPAGVYGGHVSLKGLRDHGDFGIGTYEGLDGEMILLEGVFYQVRADGKVYRPGPAERTPFAAVTEFVPDLTQTLSDPLDMKALERLIDEFAAADLARDRGEELRAVEQENRAAKAPAAGAVRD